VTLLIYEFQDMTICYGVFNIIVVAENLDEACKLADIPRHKVSESVYIEGHYIRCNTKWFVTIYEIKKELRIDTRYCE